MMESVGLITSHSCFVRRFTAFSFCKVVVTCLFMVFVGLQVLSLLVQWVQVVSDGLESSDEVNSSSIVCVKVEATFE